MDYTTDYRIYTPRLKGDAGWRPAQSEQLGDLPYAFAPAVLDRHRLNAVSFNFFVLWSPGKAAKLNRQGIWLKKEISIDGPGKIDLNDAATFDQKFFENEPLRQMEQKLAFFAANGFSAAYLVLRDLKGDLSAVDPEQAVAIQVTCDRGRLKKEPLRLRELQTLLVEYSGEKLCMNKPLRYYETDLEKYLSLHAAETGAIFPGDCDMLLYDDQNMCKVILEFKKTTERDRSPLAEQNFQKYLKNDRRKYLRLNILRNYFSEKAGGPVPFITVFYSLREKDTIKLEKIGPALELSGSRLFSISRDPLTNQELLLEEILAL